MAGLTRVSPTRVPNGWRPRARAFLRPGLGLKRWLALLGAGAALFSLGVALLIQPPADVSAVDVTGWLTFGALAAALLGGAFMVAGAALAAVAGHGVYRWVVWGVSLRREGVDIVTAVDMMQRRVRGPRVVAIGGGTGMSTLLRGLKHWTANLTAIVTVADDGGSSGRLRDDLRMPPPGDARSCLVALSEADPVIEGLFDYRFSSSSHLGGHSLGNLLLAALCEKQGGFQEGLEAAARILAVSGTVVPVSNQVGLVLMGETTSGAVLTGESEVGQTPEPVRRIWLEPEGAAAGEAALKAIRHADLIVIGPGSLYTSILPNFLLREIGGAVAASDAPSVLVCNVATQPHETDGYDAGRHLSEFRAHSGVAVSHFLVNSSVRELIEGWDQAAVPAVTQVEGFRGVLVSADVVNDDFPVRHDSHKLAGALMSIWRAGGRRASRGAVSARPAAQARRAELRAIARAWSGWRWLLRRLGNLQARVLLTLTYVVFFPVIALPHRLVSDPLRIRRRKAAFVDASGVDRVSPEAARRQ